MFISIEKNERLTDLSQRKCNTSGRQLCNTNAGRLKIHQTLLLLLSLCSSISSFQGINNVPSLHHRNINCQSYTNGMLPSQESGYLSRSSRSQYRRCTYLFQSSQTTETTESESNSVRNSNAETILLSDINENTNFASTDNVDVEIDESFHVSVNSDQYSTAKISHEIALQAEEVAIHDNNELESKLTSKVLNAFLLLACFGFVSYTVLNVDQGMTRGWSMSEKAMRIPLDNWASYESSLNTQPILTKTTINVVIYLLGDWLSQTIFVKKNVLEFDALRTLRNGLIGLVFGPLVHEYYEFSDMILPVDVGINRLYKILMDQTVYLYVKCTIYIIAVNMLAGETFENSFGTARGKINGIMFTAWKFWPLVHCITYGAIPARHRILWVNCVDLFWNAILALKTSSGENEDEESAQDLVLTSEGDADADLSLIKMSTNTTEANNAKMEIVEEEEIPAAMNDSLHNKTSVIAP